MITRAPRPTSNFYLLDKAISEDKRLSWAARSNIVLQLIHAQVKYTRCKKIAAGCGSPVKARGISRSTARYAAFSIPATSFGGSDGMAKAMPGTLRVPPVFHTHSSCRPMWKWNGSCHQAQLESSMSKSIDAQRQSVSADFLPVSFTVLADAFLAYLRDSKAVTSDETIFIDKRVFGLCVAGGINQRNEPQMLRAKNYIFAELGLELSEPEAYEPVPCGQDRIIVTSERTGHVYVLRNPSLPGLVKIGYTCTTVADRVRQLSGSTSIPAPFAVVDSFPTDTPILHEARIHALLASRRMPGREFFSVTETEAVTACKNIIGSA